MAMRKQRVDLIFFILPKNTKYLFIKIGVSSLKAYNIQVSTLVYYLNLRSFCIVPTDLVQIFVINVRRHFVSVGFH